MSYSVVGVLNDVLCFCFISGNRIGNLVGRYRRLMLWVNVVKLLFLYCCVDSVKKVMGSVLYSVASYSSLGNGIDCFVERHKR